MPAWILQPLCGSHSLLPLTHLHCPSQAKYIAPRLDLYTHPALRSECRYSRLVGERRLAQEGVASPLQGAQGRREALGPRAHEPDFLSLARWLDG